MNIIVTGASRGIGYELVKKFADNESVKKIVAISRSRKELEELSEYSSKIIVVVDDLTLLCNNTEKIRNILDGISSLSIVVNNAGFLVHKAFDSMEPADMTKLMDVNFNAPYFFTKNVLPYLKRSPKAHVVNISSMGGFQGSAKFPGLSGYSASKAALASATECLAEEYKGSNLRFNCLALGAVKTEMLSEAFPNYEAPLNAEEMAEYIADFAFNGNKYYNGKVLPVAISTP